MRSFKFFLVLFHVSTLSFMMAACGGSGGGGGDPSSEPPGPTYYKVSGTVTGLNDGSVFLLEESVTGQELIISENGPINFHERENGKPYNVIVSYQPDPRPKQTCTVNRGTGTINSLDVTNIEVICSVNTYSVGGTATGVTGTLVLRNNGSDDLTITGDRTFTFAMPVADTATYRVTVQSPPAGQACSVNNQSGTIELAGVSDVNVECARALGEVKPFYIYNGADWNDYVSDDGGDRFSASDAACDPDTDTACLNGGLFRVLDVPALADCTGVTASDNMGAFDWICDNSTGTTRLLSDGLSVGHGLSNLVDFQNTDWRDMSLLIDKAGIRYGISNSAAWWSNPVLANTSGGDLGMEGAVYLVPEDTTAAYNIVANGVSMLIEPDAVLSGPGLGRNSFLVNATGHDFLWVEGEVNAMGDDAGVFWDEVRFSALRGLTAGRANTSYAYCCYRSGIYLINSTHNTLSDITASDNEINGVLLWSSSYNTLTDIVANNNGVYSSAGAGVALYNSTSNTVSDVVANENGQYGLFVSASDYDLSGNNRISRIKAANNKQGIGLGATTGDTVTDVIVTNSYWGVHLTSLARNNVLSRINTSNNIYGLFVAYFSYNNIFSDITASNNGEGILLSSYSDSNVLSGITANNNVVGVDLSYASDNTLSSVAAGNNTIGLYMGGFSNTNSFSDLTASDSTSYGVALVNSMDNYFTGELQVGSNLTENCYVISSPGISSGLVNSTCTETGLDGSNTYGIGNISDATFNTSFVTIASSFIGKVNSDDTVNSSDTNGTADWNSISDWLNFENPYRAWGIYNAAVFPDAGHQGNCSYGDTCQIWDWSLALGDTVIGEILTLPTGNDTLTHSWYGSPATQDNTGCNALVPDSIWNGTVCETTFLKRAVEVLDDGIGNDNLLCESNEKCLYTPNMGSYQGHGNLESAGLFTNGTLKGITLIMYKLNGR